MIHLPTFTYALLQGEAGQQGERGERGLTGAQGVQGYFINVISYESLNPTKARRICVDSRDLKGSKASKGIKV